MYQARELVAQRNLLGDEICAVLENGSSNGEKQCELERHSANDRLGPIPGKTLQFRLCIE